MEKLIHVLIGNCNVHAERVQKRGTIYLRNLLRLSIFTGEIYLTQFETIRNDL